MARPTGRDLRTEILDTATDMIQRVGVRAFSYGDLAAALSVKAPTVHHHVGTKERLVALVANRYRHAFDAALAATTVDLDDPAEAIAAFADLFATSAADGRLCLCGVVASEWATAGEAASAEVRTFFDDQLAWLTHQIERGQDVGAFDRGTDATMTAHAILAMLEGALLLTRAGNPAGLATSLADHVVDQLRIDDRTAA